MNELFTLDENIRGTRGHSWKLAKVRCTRDCCKYFFQIVINRWNQLDQRTVGASSIIVFKGHLHKIRETIQGAAKKSSPLMVFANFSAVVPEFKVKFGTLV